METYANFSQSPSCPSYVWKRIPGRLLYHISRDWGKVYQSGVLWILLPTFIEGNITVYFHTVLWKVNLLKVSLTCKDQSGEDSEYLGSFHSLCHQVFSHSAAGSCFPLSSSCCWCTWRSSFHCPAHSLPDSIQVNLSFPNPISAQLDSASIFLLPAYGERPFLSLEISYLNKSCIAKTLHEVSGDVSWPYVTCFFSLFAFFLRFHSTIAEYNHYQVKWFTL